MRVHGVQVHALAVEMLHIMAHGFTGYGFGQVQDLRERYHQRRADDSAQIHARGRLGAHLGQRVAHGSDDALIRAGQRAVQVEENRVVWEAVHVACSFGVVGEPPYRGGWGSGFDTGQ